ncbi:MAG TPA: hypothetical protein VHY09_16035 [Candidatus Methylacidiphilales bacterium]|jgi:hypothetical protein|nr:hypothetical protein [Candidatus Methylacidiphilales bacterium]
MSSASTPAPSRGAPASTSRHNYFWPLFIFLLGAFSLAFYQVESLNSQLAEITSAADRLDPQVKLAEYQKAKFYAMARDLLRMAPTHPAAEKLVSDLGVRKLAAAQPMLMSLAQPSGFTNSAPALPPAPSHAQPKTNIAPSALIQ